MIKLLGDSKGVNLCDTGLGNGFYNNISANNKN